MKIAFLVGKFPGLSKTFILNQITGLLDRGHRVNIFATQPGEVSKQHPEVEEYNLTERIHYAPKVPPRYIPRLLGGLRILFKNILRKPKSLMSALNILKHGRSALSLRLLYKADWILGTGTHEIVHCHFGPRGKIGILLKDLGLFDGKIITTFHGYDVNRLPKQQGEGLYDELFQKGDLFTVNTEFTKKKVIDLGAEPDKIRKLPVGLKLDRFPYQERNPRNDDPIQLLTVARLVEKKGHQFAIHAVNKVSTGQNLEYHILGDGPLRHELEQLIQELGVGDTVHLHGWMDREEVVAFYRRSDIFILASVTASDGDQEGQGLVLQEAQAMGLPVISTNHNGIPEGVEEGKSTFLVQEKDEEGIAEKIEYLIDRPEERVKMGRKGRKFVETNFDINMLNNRLVKIYKGILD